MKSGRRKPRPSARGFPLLCRQSCLQTRQMPRSKQPRQGRVPTGQAPGAPQAQAPRALERRKGPAFDLLCPKGQRPQRAVEVKSSQTDVVPAAEAAKTAEQGNGPTPEAGAATAGASVLKSGVVNGMPYTLYSDGSIEAQLPEG